jgi:hypothetical protein
MIWNIRSFSVRRRLSDVIQTAGVILLSAGIAVEMVARADIGYLIISVGSLIFTIGTKLKKY